MNNKQIILYGIGGANKAFGVLGYYTIYLDNSFDIVGDIRREATRLKAKNPCIEAVYMISNRRGLRKEYLESIRLNSIESHFIFKDILEREGMKLQV